MGTWKEAQSGPGEERDQGGDEGGMSQGGDRRDLKQEEPGATQATAMTAEWPLTPGVATKGVGAGGGDGEPMRQGDGEDLEVRGGTDGTTTEAEAWIRKAAGELERQRTEEESKGWTSLMEPEGRRYEAQPEEWSPEV